MAGEELVMENEFLGRGWSFPPAFRRCKYREADCGHVGNVEMVSAEEDIRQSIEILFSTEPGERLMHPDFGCSLKQFLFEDIDQGLITSLTRTITDAILDHEPRILLDQINIYEDRTTPGLLHINLTYTIKATNSRYNLVYPFYLNEAV